MAPVFELELLDVGELLDAGELLDIGELLDVVELVDAVELVDVNELLDITELLGVGVVPGYIRIGRMSISFIRTTYPCVFVAASVARGAASG
ncbi:unnamed protein product [Penicillium crustosum]